MRNEEAIRELTKFGAADRNYSANDRIYKVQQYMHNKKTPFDLHGIRVTDLNGTNTGIVWEDDSSPNKALSKEFILEKLDSTLGIIANDAVPMLYTALALRGIKVEPLSYLPGLDKIIVKIPKDVYDSISDVEEKRAVIPTKCFHGIYLTYGARLNTTKISGYNVQSKKSVINMLHDIYGELGFDWLGGELDVIRETSEED